jgi:hypothetical protein
MSILAILRLPVCLGVVIPEVNNYGIGLRAGVETVSTANATLSNIFRVVIAL